MDEEDLAALKEGQTLIDTTEEMDLSAGTRDPAETEQECVRFQQCSLSGRQCETQQLCCFSA